jgi:hypothetical protein
MVASIAADQFFNAATGVAVDGQGNVYVVAGNNALSDLTSKQQVAVYAPTREYANVALVGPALVGPLTVEPRWLRDPRRVALDDSGYICVTDGGPPARIVVFPPQPKTLPDPYGEVNCARFQSPVGISICRNVIYVADPVAKAVFVFSPAAIVPFDSGQLAEPVQTIVGGDVPFAAPYGLDAVALPWLQFLRPPIVRPSAVGS